MIDCEASFPFFGKAFNAFWKRALHILYIYIDIYIYRERDSIYIHLYIHTVRPTMGPTLGDPFREVVGFGS